LQRYVGEELELFAKAQNWKAYLSKELAPFLRGAVLEVGAGIGATAAALCDGTPTSWLCLEPDPTLVAAIEAKLAARALPPCCRVAVGTLADLPASDRFDTIIYVDVLEHIEGDAAELALAAARLRPGGSLIVLAPAHPALYSPFDAAVGHFRRYAKRSLTNVVPRHLGLVRLRYLDAAGLLASAANRAILRRAVPSGRDLQFWDRALVPVSRVIDPLLGHHVGRSLLGVWCAPGSG
jgi:SAM-dependent methyltransferase